MSSTEKIFEAIGDVLVIGAVVAIGAVMVAGAICYLSDSKNENKTNDSDNILSNTDRFDTYKEVVEEMIEKKEWDELENMLKNNLALKDFPEIIKMIKDALENR
ncbi:hypothetical protein O6B96_04870 [Campylobacter ureolyticus]|uniref:hypothetical protein n=1 Tax=Campylobacter ureolyticus TaxID=827 RepID=UPI0022B482DF|nr:hypothetical protein [Campylobacter ureolyticus]MCZ6150383.1 hypothetical protein [Campylobacter ureolyticus]